MGKKGFTLIELLAVIVILAIILAVAIPNISGAIENSRKEAFKTSLNSALKAAQIASIRGTDNGELKDLKMSSNPFISGSWFTGTDENVRLVLPQTKDYTIANSSVINKNTLLSDLKLVSYKTLSGMEFDGTKYIELPTLPNTININDGLTVEFQAEISYDSEWWSRIFDFGPTSGDYEDHTNDFLISKGGESTLRFDTGETGGYIHCDYVDLSAKNSYKFVFKKNPLALASNQYEYIGYDYHIYINNEEIANNSNSDNCISEINYGYYNGLAFENVDRSFNYLGKSNWDNPLLIGKIYDFKLLDSNNNLVVSYVFDNSNQTTITDYSGNNYTAYVINQ